MAGAEGIDPSARGFGGDVEKPTGRGAVRPFQAIAESGYSTLRRDDALLMLSAAFPRLKTALTRLPAADKTRSLRDPGHEII